MTPLTVRGADGEPIAITGVGMVSSLGIDAVSACAAARAGLSRAMAIEDLLAWDNAEADTVPVHGHVVRQLTDGFSGLGRLIRLGLAAWADLDRSDGGRPARSRYGLYVATTNGYYAAEARGRDVDASMRADFIADVESEYQEQIADRILGRLVARRGGPPPNAARVATGQQASFTAALIDAITDLRSGAIVDAIVGGIDSLVDPRVVAALGRLGLLKSPDNSAGVAPGEGAAFLRLTRQSTMAPGQRPIAFISHAAWARGLAHRFSDEAPVEQLLLGLLRDAPPAAQNATRLLMLSTLNGDPVRALEWGSALVSLPPWAHAAEHVYPAVSFGDAGAAAGAMNAVLALRTCARSRAGYTGALVWAVGDDGGKGAIWLQPANGSIS